jgi:hypothetical protein
MIHIRRERYNYIRFLVETKQNRRRADMKINPDYRELPLPLPKKEVPRLPVKEILNIVVWVVLLTLAFIVINMYGR